MDLTRLCHFIVSILLTITVFTQVHIMISVPYKTCVILVAQSMHIFSVKDKNLVFTSMSYYGVIQDTCELDYTIFCILMFWCKWVENNHGMKVDESGFLLVDPNKVGQKEGTFILTSQAK